MAHPEHGLEVATMSLHRVSSIVIGKIEENVGTRWRRITISDVHGHRVEITAFADEDKRDNVKVTGWLEKEDG